MRTEYDDPRKPDAKYMSIWYDQWRIVDGRADEHWDTATLSDTIARANWRTPVLRRGTSLVVGWLLHTSDNLRRDDPVRMLQQ